VLKRFRMRRLVAVTLVLFLAAAAAGCGATSPVRLTSRPDVQNLLPNLPRFRNWTIAVSPVVLQQVDLYAREGVYAATVEPDAEHIQSSLVSMLRELEIFREVMQVEGQATNSLTAALKAARAAGTNVILVPKVKQFDVTYVQRNGAHIPKIIVWSLFEWMSWFMADEIYRVDMTCDFDFRYGADGNRIRNFLRVKSTEKAVSDFQRGIKIWGMVRIPGSLHEDNFRNVASVLGPHAVQEMQVDFLSSVLPAFQRIAQTPTVAGRIGGTEPSVAGTNGDRNGTDIVVPVEKEPERCVAHIFGVDNYDELTISPLRRAASDAKSFREILAKSAEPKFKYNDVHLVVNEWASLSAMERALDDVVATSKEKLHTAVFYFAGRGAVTEDERGEPVFYLLPQNADMTNLADSALSLGELASSLRSINAKYVIIILDCGFDPAGTGRSAPTGARFLSTINYPTALHTRPGYSLLTAAAAGAPAYESDTTKAGLLTYLLLKATTSSEALGSDGSLEMREAFKYLRTAVPSQAGKLGLRQSPKLLGTGTSSVLVGKKKP
jgi:hypothetical protein